MTSSRSNLYKYAYNMKRSVINGQHVKNKVTSVKLKIEILYTVYCNLLVTKKNEFPTSVI
jgi:hypothetical protein